MPGKESPAHSKACRINSFFFLALVLPSASGAVNKQPQYADRVQSDSKRGNACSLMVACMHELAGWSR